MKMKALRVLGSSGLGFLLFVMPAFASTVAVSPTADGSFSQFTPSSGTSHFSLVNEAVCDGLSTLNSTTNAGNRDSYTVSLSSIPDGAIISGIDITPCASRVSSGGANPIANVFYRLNGVNSADAGNYVLTVTTPATLATASYTGLRITKGVGSSLEIGAVLTSGSKGIRLSKIASIITYSFVEAPTSLTGSATTTASSTPAVALSWTDNSSSETAFVVEGKLSTSSIWKTMATTTANSVSYTDSTVASTTGTYNHRVRAWNGTVYSAYSNTATTTIP